ncbi:MAG TPA: GNAT family N-acetyltransferase [Rhodothermales bacterium]|nr:GNAT family N-acetyltransferase [Rhodothermales bacterium]
MRIEIGAASTAALAAYAQVPIAFEVGAVLDVSVQDRGLGGMVLSERSLDVPYIKDYDAIDGAGPALWADRFDMSNWALFAAHSGARHVGGAAVAVDTADLTMLENRRDLAVLWDIRVTPEARGQGVGSALFKAAEAWAAARGCRQIKAETQNINVPACRFYARMGCVLGGIHRFAYPELPEEIQLLWYKLL